jgi:hypothetical protein
MNVQLPVRLDKPAFLAWVQGREERYELVKGRVVMMVGASRAHAQIVPSLLVALHHMLDPRQWTVISDFGLDAEPETLRYPDIMVDRAGGRGSDYTATSPSSSRRFSRRQQLPSISATRPRNICACPASKRTWSSLKMNPKPGCGCVVTQASPRDQSSSAAAMRPSLLPRSACRFPWRQSMPASAIPDCLTTVPRSPARNQYSFKREILLTPY